MLRATAVRTLVHSAAMRERAEALAEAVGAQVIEVERDLLDAPAAGEPAVELDARRHPHSTSSPRARPAS